MKHFNLITKLINLVAYLINKEALDAEERVQKLEKELERAQHTMVVTSNMQVKLNALGVCVNVDSRQINPKPVKINTAN